MAWLDDAVSAQFARWEERGRGWQVWPEPVEPEPPFVPFSGYAPNTAQFADDGRRPNPLTSALTRLGLLVKSPTPEPAPEAEIEPEPRGLQRSDLVELQTSLPAALNISKDTFEQFLLNLSLCREPLAFELLGVANRVTAQFATHPDDAPLVHRQLQAYFSEATFRSQASTLEPAWETCSGEDALVVEFGLAREFMLPLASGKLDPFIGIIGALTALQSDELGLFQVLFQPTQSPWSESIVRSVTHADGKPFFVNSPELASAAEHKVSKPLYAAVVRIAIRSESFGRTLQIARDLAGSLRVLAQPQGNELIPLKNDDYPFAEHVEDVLCRQSRRSGMLLNSDELIGFVHLPSSAVRSSVLQRDSGQTKAAPAIVRQRGGLWLGNNVHAGNTVEVHLSPEQRVRHLFCIGASGTGKSTFLFNLIRQDIENGQGVAVLDPHGDLIDQLLGCIPPARIQDVVLVDPSDEDYSVGFNILSAHSDLEKTLLASDLVSVFQRLSTSWGDQMGSVLNNVILAFLESRTGGTLAELRRFLIEPAFRHQFLATVNDPDIVYYWKKAFPTLAGNKSIGSILTRLDTFLSPKPIRYMVSQKENRLDFAGIMNRGKIFLAKLSQGKMGRENSYLMGSLLVAKFHQAAMSRAHLAERDRRNFWLYIDEFHNFITPSLAEILTGARKYRIGLILAHQELRQLQRDSDVASAVLSQPYTRVCFRVGDEDARKLSDGFSFFEAKALQSLPNFSAICRVERADYDFNVAIPFPKELDEAQAAEVRQQVIAVSRSKYAVSRQRIEAELAKARAETETAAPPSKKEPKQTAGVPAPEQPVEKPPPIIPPKEEPATVARLQPQAAALAAPPLPFIVAKETAASNPPPPAAEATCRIPPSQDNGIGGNQHNLIRERIELVARQLGYSTSRENPTGDGGKIDIVLEKSERAIACEIAITTTIDHEVGNVAKCLKAGFQHIAVISPSTDRLAKIENSVRSCVAPELAVRVCYFLPDQFMAHLQAFTSQDAVVASASAPSEKTIGKYKVKSQAVKLTPEEMKERESAALAMLAETMRRK